MMTRSRGQETRPQYIVYLRAFERKRRGPCKRETINNDNNKRRCWDVMAQARRQLNTLLDKDMVHGPRFLVSFSTLSTRMPMDVTNNEQPHLVHNQDSRSIVLVRNVDNLVVFCCVDSCEVQLEMENGSRPVCLSLPPAYKMFATKPFRLPFLPLPLPSQPCFVSFVSLCW